MKKFLILFLSLFIIFAAACNQTEPPAESSDGTHTESNDAENTIDISKEESLESDHKIKLGYIDFNSAFYYIGYNEEKFDKDISLIASNEELNEFYKESGIAITDRFDKSFFENNAVIFIILPGGSSSYSYHAKNIHIDENGILTATVTAHYPEVINDDYVHSLITVEVSKQDICGVVDSKLVYEVLHESSYYLDESIEPNEIGKSYIFDGRITHKDDRNSRFSCMQIAKNTYELTQITENYIHSGVGESFVDFSNKLNDDFFEENIIIAFPFYGEYQNTKIELQRVDYTAENATFHFNIDQSDVTGYEHYEFIVVLEVPKSKLGDGTTFTIKSAFTEYDYTQKLGSIDFTPYIFKGCSGGTHENIALDSLNYLPLNCFVEKQRFDAFVEELCGCYPFEDGFYDFADTLDEEFFKENAILMSYVYVDKGEKVTIDKVRRKNHLGFGVLMMYISIEDSIKPSSNDDMDVYTFIAVIDKNETIGYDWTNCNFEIK